MRRLHLMVGLLAIAAFLITGMIMRTHTPPMVGLSSDVRMMYRSRHLYILAAGAANLLLGLYLTPLPIISTPFRALRPTGQALLGLSRPLAPA